MKSFLRYSQKFLSAAVLFSLVLGTLTGHSVAQDPQDAYISGIDLLPESTAGVVRIPRLPDFCNAWQQTNLGQMIASKEMQPFVDAQRERALNYFDTLDRKIGLKAKDLYDIASGEVVFAWMAFENAKRPFSFCVIADTRGRQEDADAAGKQIDEELKAGGATRDDVSFGDETIRVYRTKPKPGQLKVEEIAISWNGDRFIAADREVVVKNLLAAVDDEELRQAFSKRESFVNAMKKSNDAIAQAKEESAKVCWEWYAEPFSMGRILREVFEYDRHDDLDIIELLEGQGFGVIEALGGVGAVNGDRFDILHRGVLLASGKLTKGARMLQPVNQPLPPVPAWPTADCGAFYRVNWDLETAFWSAESLVNAALGDDLFRPMLDGIRDDVEGPQVDFAKDFIPNLDDQILLITDNTKPVSPESDRMLVAVRIVNPDVVAEVIRKWMEVEPDAQKLDVAEFDVWQVEPGSGTSDDDLDADLAELGFGDDLEDDVDPLLNHWSIAVVRSEAEAYLMFSSHSEFLVKMGQRVLSAATGDGLDSTETCKSVTEAMKDLGAQEVFIDGVYQPHVSLRARYELLRQGKLKDSDSLLANLIRRFAEDEQENGQADPLKASLLPPFAEIESYLKGGGVYWSKSDEGWEMTGFLLKQ
ncbi:membrane or secreted protein [Stieleria sp. JC731]|uniref:membrane or secreted protein n=1 Tax=Pirellulaceae TaxID=2691357 RepID=UPI001E2C87A0|nr:membrane or secreted protein [Stieleria sp. JC731]MCC9599735.1 membrane or secreted protein [Stieleria sp. JC731]